MRARRATLGVPSLLAACALAVGGCGSGHTAGSSTDPATLAPAGVPLYAGATVRPEGSLKTAALSAGRALTRQADPYLRLLAALQTPGSPTLDFGRDVAPWLGATAGVFLSSLASASALSSLLQQGLLGGAGAAAQFPFGSGHAQGALVLDTSDVTKARSFLNTQARRAGAHARSYRGVAYQVSGGGVAFAVVSRLAVIGSESGVHEAIDTSLGAASLARQSGYAKLAAAAPAGALAHVYAAPSSAPASGAQGAGGAEGLAGAITALTGGRQANVSLVPAAASLTLDADIVQGSAPGTPGLLGGDPEGASALAELPGESWLAVGLGHVGTNLASDVGALGALTSLIGSQGPAAAEGAGAAGLNVKSLLAGLFGPLKALGANTPQARRDYTSWMGSAGIFASGGSLLELKAAVVISSTDPAASRAAVRKLATQLSRGGASLRRVSIAGTEAAVGVASSGLPVVLDIAAGRDANGHAKFVIGVGEASVSQALNPPSALSAAAPRNAAGAALGDGIQPSLIVDLPTLLSLLEGVGLTEDPTLSKVVPYLRAATTLAGGGHALGGGIERFRLVLGLHLAG